MNRDDPVREALIYGESAPTVFSSWTTENGLRRLRMRFGLTRKDLAAKAGVSASLVGRAEKGADIRLSTLKRLYAALGCRFLAVPSGGLYDLDWRQAHLDNDWIDWKRKCARYFPSPDCVSSHFSGVGDSGIHGNAIPLSPEQVK